MIAYLKIVLLTVATAIGYGIVNDQITVRVCLEYFTIGKPQVFETSSPTLLALGWGVIATWWVGLLLGIVIACFARAGSRPQLDPGQLLAPAASVLLVVILLSGLAGLIGYAGAAAGAWKLVEPLASRVPADRHQAFLAVGWAHSMAYGGVLGGTILLCRWIRSERVSAQL